MCAIMGHGSEPFPLTLARSLWFRCHSYRPEDSKESVIGQLALAAGTSTVPTDTLLLFSDLHSFFFSTCHSHKLHKFFFLSISVPADVDCCGCRLLWMSIAVGVGCCGCRLLWVGPAEALEDEIGGLQLLDTLPTGGFGFAAALLLRLILPFLNPPPPLLP